MQSSSKRFRALLTSSAVLALAQVQTSTVMGQEALRAQEAPDELAVSFLNPPISARPLVWWHWVNGNVTEEGVVKDLAWMQRIGIGGVQAFDASLNAPKIVDKSLRYMSSEWQSVFARAVELADQKGFDFGIAASPGWSETGGPWVSAADAMKKLTWSELTVQGGTRYLGVLPPPPAVSGPFMTIPHSQSPFLSSTDEKKSEHGFYRDVILLAYPVRSAPPLPSPILEVGGKELDGTLLADGHPETAVTIPVDDPNAPVSFTLSYPSVQTIRSATYFQPGAAVQFGTPAVIPTLEAGDGKAWRTIATLPIAAVPTTVGFSPVKASRFRITLQPNPAAGAPGGLTPAPGVDMTSLFAGFGGGGTKQGVPIGEFRLESEPRVDRYEAKAGFTTVSDYNALSQGIPEAKGVDPAKVIDITGKLRPDGTLDWTPPQGRWRILRLGMSLLGTTNSPATPEATGLEVDKYDGAAVRRYLTTYLDKYREAVGANMIGARGIRTLVTDSIESGDANWTPNMIVQFRKLRGYDPVPFLPALSGEIIESRAKSDAFLNDFRQTLSDLLASEHYGTVAQVAHEYGLKVFGEALEDQRPQLGDDMSMRSHADVPMAAMWVFGAGGQPRPGHMGDIRGAASVSHVYGRGLVAAESMTSGMAPYAFAPADLKRVIDMEFVNGINRPVIHSSVHQPIDEDVPGLTLMIFGQYFNRHETWAEMAKPWVDYIARSSYMLQQGSFVADLAYFSGEEAPLTVLWEQGRLKDAPTANAYDFVNRDIVLNEMSVSGGELVTRGGARYKALYLGGSSERMTLAVLKKLASLAEAGATIIGKAPQSSPSLGDDPKEFSALAERLWTSPVTVVGKGRVMAGGDLAKSLLIAGIEPDLTIPGAGVDAMRLPFLHRRLPDGELYYIVNRDQAGRRIEASFRVAGKIPELWRASSGTSEAISYRVEGGRTIVPLDLLPEDAVFIVFRKNSAETSDTVPTSKDRQIVTLDGPWSVNFQSGRGAPASKEMTSLHGLEKDEDAGIKYFSGVASYHSTFKLPNVWKGDALWLDLGMVGDVAEVRVNGTFVGTSWRAPYRLDISKAVRTGVNQIEVSVANLWVNRLIGDAQPGATKVAHTTGPSYSADAPLRRSGLIGPVIVGTSTTR